MPSTVEAIRIKLSYAFGGGKLGKMLHEFRLLVVALVLGLLS